MEALLDALRTKRWTRRRRPNVSSEPCFTELAHRGNGNAAIFELALATAPHRHFEFAQLNKSVEMQRHRDKYNREGSLLLLLGDFSGGALRFDDGRCISDTGVWTPFHGQEPHWVEPFEGERFSLILFNNPSLAARLARLQRRSWPPLPGLPAPDVEEDGDYT